MKFVYPLLLSFGVVLTQAAIADPVAAPHAEPSEDVLACLPENPNYPYYRATGSESDPYPGLYFDLIEEMERRSGRTISVRRAPWPRCMNELKQHRVDLVFTASYLPEREEYGCYPRDADGEVDPSRRIVSFDYHLYVRDSDLDSVSVEEGQIKGLRGLIGIREGQSITHVLERLGRAYVGLRSNEIAFRQLANGRVSAVAMIDSIGDSQVLKRPGLARIDPALVTRDYYMLVSHPHCQPDGLAEQLWNTARAINEDGWFARRRDAYLIVDNWMVDADKKE